MQEVFFVQPQKSYSELVNFIENDNQRILFCTGVSGVGKSTLLKYVSSTVRNYLYIDASVNNDQLAILKELYWLMHGEDSLINCITNQLSSLHKIYIKNVGNVSVESSNINNSPIINDISFNIGHDTSIDPGLFLLSSKIKVFEKLKEQPYCVIIDQFESSEDNPETLLLIRSILNECTNVNVVISSRKIIKNNFTEDGLIKKYQINGFSSEESAEYLSKREVKNKKTIHKALSFCEGHPLFLKMFADAYEKNLDFQLSLEAVSKNDRFRFLFNCIGEALPYEVRKVFYKLPLCRYFSLELINHAFKFDSFTGSEIIKNLIEDLYVEQIGKSGLYRFHELFSNLQRKEVAKDERIEFDEVIINFYKKRLNEKGSISSLHELVEPFYHLQHVSSERGFEYFENIYKPILDKKQKSIANILISQIITDLHENSLIKNWYSLRIGGYFREFGLYDIANDFFSDILSSNDLDDTLEAYSLNNLGICHMFSGRQKEARRCFHKSVEICSKLGLTIINGHNYNNLGISWSNDNNFKESKNAYEQSLQYYQQDNIEGLYIGKLLQNYANLLLENGNLEHAYKSALKAENEYLKDGDMIGGMTCRMIASDCCLHLGKYKNALEIMEPHVASFDKILKEYNLKENRPQLHYNLASISFYNNNKELLLTSIVNFLSHSLLTTVKEHHFLANVAIKLLVLFNNQGIKNDLFSRIRNNVLLSDVANDLINFLSDSCDQKLIIIDSNKILHTISCPNYQQGHYINIIQVISPSLVLQDTNIESCQCMTLNSPTKAFTRRLEPRRR